MARVRIRKLPGGLLQVRVEPTNQNEQRAERSSIVKAGDLESTVRAKMETLKQAPVRPAPGS